MFSFFKKKTPPPIVPPSIPVEPSAPEPSACELAAIPTPAPEAVTAPAPVITAAPAPMPVPVPPAPAVAPAPMAPASAPTTPIESAAPAARRYGSTSTFIAPAAVVVAPIPPSPPEASAPPAAPAASAALIPETAERPANPADAKRSWIARLKAGLSKTSSSLSLLFVGARIDDALYDELESALLMADAGIDATTHLLEGLRKKVKEDKLLEPAAVKGALKALMIELLTPLQKPLELGRHEPMVMMIAGVNGAGKTTTIGKLAKHMQRYEQSVLLAAGDTFRAAAREQLMVWGQRNNVTVIAQESGDPAAVAYDAVQSGKARRMDVVMVDTAGRLPTQLHLMEELKKIKRVIGKGMDGAPHELLLVIDGNTGQNALAQVKAFDDALALTGLVITKLDGTAKGGVLAAIARTRPVPVYFIGVGEKIDDLQPFNAEEFVDALLG
ncbi:MAG: signal recognition particle-docking protein FtsY [Pseudomonadota bacterium]